MWPAGMLSGMAKEMESYELNNQSFKIRGVPVKVIQTNVANQ
jgi:hypothetical protein